MDPKYPAVTVPLIGEDGNGFFIVSRVSRALRTAGVPAPEIAEFQKEATSGDYDHLLATVQAWVSTR